MRVARVLLVLGGILCLLIGGARSAALYTATLDRDAWLAAARQDLGDRATGLQGDFIGDGVAIQDIRIECGRPIRSSFGGKVQLGDVWIEGPDGSRPASTSFADRDPGQDSVIGDLIRDPLLHGSTASCRSAGRWRLGTAIVLIATGIAIVAVVWLERSRRSREEIPHPPTAAG